MSASTSTVAGAPAVLDVSGTKPVPFTRQVTVELRKMVDTRAGLWLMITIALLTALFVVLLYAFGDSGGTDERTFLNYLATTTTPQGFLLPVLGILLITSEWTQRTALVTFTLSPKRWKVIAAKGVAALLIGLAAMVVAIVMAAIATLISDAPGAWDGVSVGDFANFGLLQSLGVLQGLAFGLLFLNSAIAIVVFFVVPIVFNVLVSLISWLRDAAPWIDLSTAQTPLLGFDPSTGQDAASGMNAEAWGQLGTATLIWIVVPIAIGMWRVHRNEAK
ncbi:MAG: ABC transporter permease [Nocardioides sp.]|nr:ABC transporter permease [Nocardioides sp.]